MGKGLNCQLLTSAATFASTRRMMQNLPSWAADAQPDWPHARGGRDRPGPPTSSAPRSASGDRRRVLASWRSARALAAAARSRSPGICCTGIAIAPRPTASAPSPSSCIVAAAVTGQVTRRSDGDASARLRLRVAPAARLAGRRSQSAARHAAALAVQPRWFISGCGHLPADGAASSVHDARDR